MPWKADTETYLFSYSSCPTLVFYRKNCFILLFFHESRINFNQLKVNKHFIECTAALLSYLKST